MRLRIFVPQINVDVVGLDGPGGDQRAFENAVRVGVQAKTVLERSRLALVGVDREDAGFGSGAAGIAISATWESRRRPIRAVPRPPPWRRRRPATARHRAGIEARHSRRPPRRPPNRDRAGCPGWIEPVATASVDRCGRRIGDLPVADDRDRGVVASADAGRRHHPRPGPERVVQGLHQVAASRHFAGDALADAHGERRRRRRLPR